MKMCPLCIALIATIALLLLWKYLDTAKTEYYKGKGTGIPELDKFMKDTKTKYVTLDGPLLTGFIF